MTEPLSQARILIVDDQQANIDVLERFVRQAGYVNIRSTVDSRQVLGLFMAEKPDIVLLDLAMPHLDGFAVMRQLTPRIDDHEYLPILVLTAEIGDEAKRRALTEGAKDFLRKPLDPVEVLLRVKNLLQTRMLHRELQAYNSSLEETVKRRTEELAETRLEVLERLAVTAEYRDDDTKLHTQRVGIGAGELAHALGMPEDEAELIRRTAPLHDLGKIAIPDSILLKPGKLTAEEFEEMKEHATIGATILSGSRHRILQLAEEIALTHHEKWDGTGYAGLIGESIPLAGRIVAIVDVFDALTHVRPYKKAWPIDEALAEIESQRGRHFDPNVTDAFLHLHRAAAAE